MIEDTKREASAFKWNFNTLEIPIGKIILFYYKIPFECQPGEVKYTGITLGYKCCREGFKTCNGKIIEGLQQDDIKAWMEIEEPSDYEAKAPTTDKQEIK